MKKVLLLYMAPVSGEDQMKSSDSTAREASMKKWVEWFTKVGDNVVDKGQPCGMVMDMTKDGVTDGKAPFVGGYSIVQAEDMETLKGWLADHPHLSTPGYSIQVIDLLDAPGM